MITSLEYLGLTLSQYDNSTQRGYNILRSYGFDMASVRLDVQDRGGSHGAAIGSAFYGRRQMVVEGEIWGASQADFETMRKDFIRAFSPHRGVNRVNIVTRSDARYVADVIASGAPGLDYSAGDIVRCPFRMTLVSGYPYLLSATEQYVNIYPSVDGGGPMVAPMPYPFTGVNGSNTTINNGNGEAYPVITIYGPIQNFTLKNQTTGKQISVTYTLTVSDNLTIDTYNNTILLNSNNNVYSSVAGNIEDLYIPVGSSQWTIIGTNTNVSTYVRITYRDHYIGI